jgi:hypothetical protein
MGVSVSEAITYQFVNSLRGAAVVVGRTAYEAARRAVILSPPKPNRTPPMKWVRL